jgi:RNA polymerase sigma factor (sigma-70 family)
VTDEYSSYRGLLCYLATRRFGIPEDEAGAVVQDVFVAYLRNQQQINDSKAWLVGATCNASRQYWRKRGREAKALDHIQPSAAEPFDLVRRMDAARALSMLSPRCREVLRLRFAEEYPSATIAEKLSTTVAYARKLVYQCMAATRRLMGNG